MTGCAWNTVGSESRPSDRCSSVCTNLPVCVDQLSARELHASVAICSASCTAVPQRIGLPMYNVRYRTNRDTKRSGREREREIALDVDPCGSTVAPIRASGSSPPPEGRGPGEFDNRRVSVRLSSVCRTRLGPERTVADKIRHAR